MNRSNQLGVPIREDVRLGAEVPTTRWLSAYLYHTTWVVRRLHQGGSMKQKLPVMETVCQFFSSRKTIQARLPITAVAPVGN